jgi:hypothetical protein
MQLDAWFELGALAEALFATPGNFRTLAENGQVVGGLAEMAVI